MDVKIKIVLFILGIAILSGILLIIFQNVLNFFNHF